MISRLCLLMVTTWTGWAVGKATDYCRFTPEHTMCKYSGRGPRCGPQVRASGVNPNDAITIVALHNQMRSRVARGEETRGAPGPQRSGANIRTMKWDEELATMAQRHADQCVFKHECSDCRRVDRFAVGQNLFMSFQSNLDLRTEWNRSIHSWYNEVAGFPNSNIHPFKFSLQTGHYTQMLWWDTSRIGCGFIMFRENGWWKKLYTCNYGPAGNIIFSQMYLPGAPCSSCPAGTSCSLNYPGLCDGRDRDTEASSTVMQPTSAQDDNTSIFGGFNGFSGLININSTTPNNGYLEAIMAFFNKLSRTRLIRAPPTTSSAGGSVQSGSLSAASVAPMKLSQAEITGPINTANGADDASAKLTPAVATTSATTTTANKLPLQSVSATTHTPPLLTLSASAITSPSPPQTDSLASTVTMEAILSNNSEASSFSPAKSDVERVGMNLEELRSSEKGVHEESTRGNQLPFSLMSFLLQAGKNTQVIRTNSLNNVQDIIQALPEGTKPIVLFRSRSGQLTELNATSPSPIPSRANRSTRRRVTDPARLLTCDMDLSPCTMSAAGGKWMLTKTLSEGRHIEIYLNPGEEAQVLVKTVVNTPPSGVACVAFTHRRDLLPDPVNAIKGNPADTTNTVNKHSTLFDLQVGVMPLGRHAIHKSVVGVAGVWELSRITFPDIDSPFLVMLSVEPAPRPAKVAFDALTVTDGPCCLSGRC